MQQTREEHGLDMLTLAEGKRMTQEAPYPVLLEKLVERVSYRPGWEVRLRHMDRSQGSTGLTLVITTKTLNSYPPFDQISVNHLFPVVPASYDEESWRWWLFQKFMLVEQHECMEFFTVHDYPGSEKFTKPYAPLHGPGKDPYMVTAVATDLDRRTAFTGEVNSE